jgi:hypothetical protein
MESDLFDNDVCGFAPPTSCDVAVSHIKTGDVNGLALFLTPAEVGDLILPLSLPTCFSSSEEVAQHLWQQNMSGYSMLTQPYDHTSQTPAQRC